MAEDKKAAEAKAPPADTPPEKPAEGAKPPKDASETKSPKDKKAAKKAKDAETVAAVAATADKPGALAVLVNPAARCVNIPGLGLMKPGRNLVSRKAANSKQVMNTMKTKTVKNLGIGIVDPGKPEQMGDEAAAKVVAETFVIEDLETMLETERREAVRDAIKKQIALIKDVKKPEGDESGTTK